jgi:hypothetical protein
MSVWDNNHDDPYSNWANYVYDNRDSIIAGGKRVYNWAQERSKRIKKEANQFKQPPRAVPVSAQPMRSPFENPQWISHTWNTKSKFGRQEKPSLNKLWKRSKEDHDYSKFRFQSVYPGGFATGSGPIKMAKQFLGTGGSANGYKFYPVFAFRVNVPNGVAVLPLQFATNSHRYEPSIMYQLYSQDNAVSDNPIEFQWQPCGQGNVDDIGQRIVSNAPSNNENGWNRQSLVQSGLKDRDQTQGFNNYQHNYCDQRLCFYAGTNRTVDKVHTKLVTFRKGWGPADQAFREDGDATVNVAWNVEQLSLSEQAAKNTSYQRFVNKLFIHPNFTDDYVTTKDANRSFCDKTYRYDAIDIPTPSQTDGAVASVIKNTFWRNDKWYKSESTNDLIAEVDDATAGLAPGGFDFPQYTAGDAGMNKTNGIFPVAHEVVWSLIYTEDYGPWSLHPLPDGVLGPPPYTGLDVPSFDIFMKNSYTTPKLGALRNVLNP